MCRGVSEVIVEGVSDVIAEGVSSDVIVEGLVTS